MRATWILAIGLAAGCGGDDDGGATPDAPAAIDASGDDPDAPAPDGGADGCGTETPPLAMIADTEGIAIADDGTIYYSQSGHVGRWVPGAAAPEDDWVALAGTSTVWGMALAGDTLYVATPASTPTAGNIWSIDTTAATPSATMLYPNAGRPNGLTIGPDGAVYYGHFVGSGHVYRLTPAGERTQVTTDPIASPNGVLFDDDGTLLVALYNAGEIWRITLDAEHQESARARVGVGAGNPDGIARDADGRYYVTDNGGGDVLRYDATFANPEPIAENVAAAANMAFGRGALPCTDLYVTSATALRRIEAGVTGTP